MKAKLMREGKVIDVNLGDMDFETTMDFNLLNMLVMCDMDRRNLLEQSCISLIAKLQASGYMRKDFTPNDIFFVKDNIKTILSLYNVASQLLDLPKEEQTEHVANLMKKMEDNHVYETICKGSDSE